MYLHFVHDEVSAKDGESFLWMVLAVFLRPCGLTRRRETNHHQYLTLGRSGRPLRKLTMMITF